MKSIRIQRWFLYVALLCTVSGCIGHREARRVSGEMIRSSQRATEVVNGLKKASLEELKAHQETRRTVTTLHEAWLRQVQQGFRRMGLAKCQQNIDCSNVRAFTTRRTIQPASKRALELRIEKKPSGSFERGTMQSSSRC